MLEVSGLSVAYGPVQALRDVSFRVERGSIMAVLGANGAGKTTLLRAITGLTRPASGSVRLAGEELTRLPVEDVVRRGVAHVPEGRGIIEELTVEENLRLGALWRRDRADRPRVLLLDEPSLGLAPLITAQLMALLRDLTRAGTLTVVLVEQNARSALSIADRAVVLNLGQVVVAEAAAVVAADSALRHHYLGF